MDGWQQELSRAVARDTAPQHERTNEIQFETVAAPRFLRKEDNNVVSSSLSSSPPSYCLSPLFHRHHLHS